MKVSLQTPSNAFCPQTFYTYGTYKEDGTPNFGLFCWLSFCWDGEMCVMACIGGEKLTKDRIRATGVFSANLVTEELLPQADYFGRNLGYDAGKMQNVEVSISKGAVLNVPVMDKSPWVFELEVKKTIPLDDGDVFICSIKNTLVDENLAGKIHDRHIPVNEAKPVIGYGGGTYFKIGEMLTAGV